MANTLQAFGLITSSIQKIHGLNYAIVPDNDEVEYNWSIIIDQ